MKCRQPRLRWAWAQGMAGGSAGQFMVGPMIKNGMSWDRFWIYAGILGLVISALLFILLPRETPKPVAPGFVT